MNRNQINCLFEKTSNILYTNLDISRLAFTTSLTSHHWRLHGGSKHCPSQKYNTKEVPCHNTLKKEWNKLSSSTSNFDATSEQCHVGIQLVICFAKTSQLFNANHWNTSALAQKIGCRFPFAKVLDAVENSKDTVLMTRSMHCDALFGTDWSSKLDRHDIHLRIAELCQAKSKCLKSMKCVMQNSFCWCQSKKLLKTSKKFTQNFEKSTLIHEFPSFLFS